MPGPTILDTMNDERLFGRWFRGDSWAAWKAFLSLLFALPRTDAMTATCMAATGRTTLPTTPIKQAWVCVGRRGGKSIIAALVAVYLAFFRDYTPYLAPGEIATIMVVAADRAQARVVLRFILGFIRAVPMLSAKLVHATRESIELTTPVVISINTASYKSVRGYTLAAVINDEICFWPTDEYAAEPDREILAAQLPALVTIPGSLMCNISSPYSRGSAMYRAYETHYGKDVSDVLFWKAPSRSVDDAPVQMNRSIDVKVVERAYEEDPAVAAAEWGAEFRSDVESLFNLEMLDRVTDYDRPEILPPCFTEEAA
jgi:hypothetical protein